MGRPMTRAEPFTLPAHYVRQIADQVRCMGGDVKRWLGDCGLTEARLASPSFAVDRASFERLLAHALVVTREPAFGLFVGQPLVASTHGILGYAAASSGTLREALDLVERYARLRISLLTIRHEVAGREVRVRFEPSSPLGEIERPLVEAVVMSIKNVLVSISSGACDVRQVAFCFPAPDYTALARDMLGCEVQWGRGWSGFSVSARALDEPLKLADPEAFAQAALVCQRELEKLTPDESLSAQVRRLLLEAQGGFPSLQVAARRVHLSPRTLHRRLIDEGASYRELLEEVRHALALEHLRSDEGTMEGIAFALGYSDLANFRRAFKRWEGRSPSSFREASRAAHHPSERRAGKPATGRPNQ